MAVVTSCPRRPDGAARLVVGAERGCSTSSTGIAGAGIGGRVRQTRAVRTVLVIGIGAGDPDHLTVEAARALNRADVVFVLDKGDDRADLAAVRREILRPPRRAPAAAGRGHRPGPRARRTVVPRRRRRLARAAAGHLRAVHRRRAGRRRGGGVPRVGRPGALRQHAADPRPGARAGAVAFARRGGARHQQRAGAGGPVRPAAARRGRAGAHHDRPPAGARAGPRASTTSW